MNIKPAGSCLWDHVSLGEVMLRLDPGEERIHTTRTFRAWEGGGEYNVARGLRRCFGLRSAIVTAFVDNPVGRLLEDLILQGGVDMRHVKWLPFDGVGHAARNGLNFTERGYGVRGAVGVNDRGHTAVASLKPGDIDWNRIFKTEGARWFHCGGIFAALSETTPEVAHDGQNAYFGLGSGGIAAVRLTDGSKQWFTPLTPAAGRERNIGHDGPLTVSSDVVISGGWDGMLRILASNDGKVLWQYDTATAIATVNAVEAKGGSMGAAGPVVTGKRLLVPSGYVGVKNGMPGNVLLMFSP